MMVGMLLFWLLVVLGAIWLVRLLLDNRTPSLTGETRTPRQILDERFARGEISRTEYDHMLTDLSR